MSCFWIGWLNIYKSIHWLIHIVAQPQNRTKRVKKWMRRDTVPIKSHVQVEEKVEKSDLKATNKILKRTPVAHERTKHINMSNIHHHFVREGPQRGRSKQSEVRPLWWDGRRYSEPLWQKSKHCQKVRVLLFITELFWQLVSTFIDVKKWTDIYSDNELVSFFRSILFR